MSQSVDLRKLEQKVYLAYHQDGLLDLVIGTLILGMGLNEALGTSVWGFMSILLIIAYVPLKRRITFPRLGYVKFNVNRGGVNMLLAGGVSVAVLALFLVGMLMLITSDTSSSLLLILSVRQAPLLLYALLGLIGFGLAGWVIGLRRLLVYALLSVVIMSAGHVLHLPLFAPFLLLAGAILVTGAVLLATFLQNFPVAEEEKHVN